MSNDERKNSNESNSKSSDKLNPIRIGKAKKKELTNTNEYGTLDNVLGISANK